MSTMVDAVLGANESTDDFLVVGLCDVIVDGLSSGGVTLQYKLQPSTALPSPAWTTFPEGEFTEDTYKTVFISEHGVKCRLTGVSNNAGVYGRLARHLIR